MVGAIMHQSCLSRAWPRGWLTADAQEMQRTKLYAREVPPNAKTLTFFDCLEQRTQLPLETDQVRAGTADCAEDGKGVMGLSDCCN